MEGPEFSSPNQGESSIVNGRFGDLMLFPPYRPFSHSSVFGRDSTLERRL